MCAHNLWKLLHQLPELRIAPIFLHGLLRVLTEFLERRHVFRVGEARQQCGIGCELLEKVFVHPFVLLLQEGTRHCLLHFRQLQLLFLAFSLDMRQVLWLLLLFLLLFRLLSRPSKQKPCFHPAKTTAFLLLNRLLLLRLRWLLLRLWFLGLLFFRGQTHFLHIVLVCVKWVLLLLKGLKHGQMIGHVFERRRTIIAFHFPLLIYFKLY